MARTSDVGAAPDTDLPAPRRATLWAVVVYTVSTFLLAYPALAGQFLINPRSDQYIAGYAFLLALFSRFTGIRAGIFAHTLVDAHVYTAKPDGSMAEYDHVPGLRTQLERTPRALPTLTIDPSIQSLADIKPLLEADTETVMKHFTLSGYDPYPAIPFKVAV